MIKPKKIINEISIQNEELQKSDWRLKLDLNENIYGVSDCIYNVFKNLNKENIFYYPNKTKLLDKISEKYKLEKNNTVLANTCEEAIKALFDLYLESDGIVLSSDLVSDLIIFYAKVNGAEVKSLGFKEEFVSNIEKITENINEKIKIIYLSSPNIVTGEIISVSLIEVLLKKFPDVLVVVDCTYINFADSVVIDDFIDLYKKYENLVILKSFSCDYGLAGLCGAVVIANSDITKNLNKILPSNNINSVAINCISYALNEDKRMEEIKELNLKAKTELINGLNNLGYEVFKSEANFVLCDFKQHCEFYYEKLKQNGVIVKKFKKNSPVETCLGITVPKLSGVKFILELLKVKDVLIFDIGGVIIDESESYISAISETFEYFAKEKIQKTEIMQIKNQSEMNCGWDVVDVLLKKYDIDIQMCDIINVFQDLYFNYKNENQLIDKEKLLISKEIFEKLAKKFDLVIFSERFREEINYSFEKFGISQYFYYYITGDDLPKSLIKPSPKGLFNILEHCPHHNIGYFGDGIDDILAGNGAKIQTIGVIPPYADFNILINNFKHLGASYILDDINLIYEFANDVFTG